jgi:beta-glucanase (GH16 family)
MTKESHTWAIKWEEGRITWYLDGEPVHVYEGPTPEGTM